MLEYFISFLQIISYFFALICSFFALCIVCDEHLIPTIEVFIIQFQIPEEVAGSIEYALSVKYNMYVNLHIYNICI